MPFDIYSLYDKNVLHVFCALLVVGILGDCLLRRGALSQQGA